VGDLGAILRGLWGEDDARSLSVLEMTFRAVVIFLVTIVLVRLGKKRLLARNSALDFVVAVVLGSVLSRTINGSAPLVPTLAASAALIFMHWLLSLISLHSHRFGALVKGEERVLVRDGVLDRKAMQKSHVSVHDLYESLRLEAHVDGIEQIREARLERNGRISVLRRSAAVDRE
jgi:uncharacterized membrane protein YcaP (DUF421 family)